MQQKDKQLSLFSNADFAPRSHEQGQSGGLSAHGMTIVSIGNDCFYYMGAGNCHIHGDAIGCEECDDYRSINQEDEDDD